MVLPTKLNPLFLLEKGKKIKKEVVGIVSDIPYKIAQKEVEIILNELGWDSHSGRADTVQSNGPGNIVYAKLDYELLPKGDEK